MTSNSPLKIYRQICKYLEIKFGKMTFITPGLLTDVVSLGVVLGSLTHVITNPAE
jgi:hypothetical protein